MMNRESNSFSRRFAGEGASLNSCVVKQEIKQEIKQERLTEVRLTVSWSPFGASFVGQLMMFSCFSFSLAKKHGKVVSLSLLDTTIEWHTQWSLYNNEKECKAHKVSCDTNTCLRASFIPWFFVLFWKRRRWKQAAGNKRRRQDETKRRKVHLGVQMVVVVLAVPSVAFSSKRKEGNHH